MQIGAGWSHGTHKTPLCFRVFCPLALYIFLWFLKPDSFPVVLHTRIVPHEGKKRKKKKKLIGQLV